MKTFAVIDGINIINIIIANSKEDAEQVTEKTCIEYDNIPVQIGGTYENGNFIEKKPYFSWILNEENKWVSPVQRPDDTDEFYYSWDEESVSWTKHLVQ